MKTPAPMAKLLTLFKREAVDAPIAPVVADEITSVETALAALETGRGAAVLEALTEGGDANAVAKLDTEATALRLKLSNLQAAHRAASERDAHRAADERYQRQLADLEVFKSAMADRDAAVATFCEAAKVAAESYRAIFELSDAIAAWLPESTQLPSGFSAHAGEVQVDGIAQAAPLDHLAAHEFYRHSGIERPGQTGALPGAKPFSLSTLFRSAAIEPWSESTKRLSAYLAESVKNQIERDRQIELRAIEITMEADVA